MPHFLAKKQPQDAQKVREVRESNKLKKLNELNELNELKECALLDFGQDLKRDFGQGDFRQDLSQECKNNASQDFGKNLSDGDKNSKLSKNSGAKDFMLAQNLKIYPKLHSLKSPNLALIPIKSNQIFFLQEIKRENDLLINGLKITRPTPAETLKTALRAISQDYEILSHNLNANKPISNPHFLLSPNELLSRVFGIASVQAESIQTDSSNAKSSPKSNTLKIPKNPKIFLEIGFGSGRHILHLAKANPHDIFIGLEVHTTSIEQVLKNIALQNLNNLFILHFDARVLLEVLPSNSLDCIFLHFPVPWNDSKTRRVFSKHFLELALRVLKKDGILELKTDDEIYFADALELCENLPKDAIKSSIQTAQDLQNIHTKSSPKSNPKINSQDFSQNPQNQLSQNEIISKYQARWLRQNKNIYTLKIKSLRKNHIFVLKWRFIFDKNLVKSVLSKRQNLKSLINHKQVFENGFLHISDIFMQQTQIPQSKSPKSQNLAKRLAFIVRMGDFSQPTSCVIVFESCEKSVMASYLKEPPLPTEATIEAHKRLTKLLEKL